MRATLDEIRLLEELNFNAWPSLTGVHVDGWLVRRTGGISRRVNSVNALAAGRMALGERLAACEALYRSWGMRSVFRITPLSESGLEEMLLGRGYAVEAPTYVMVADLGPRKVDPRVRLAEVFEAAWPEASARLRGLPEDEATILAAQHRLIAVPTLWASALSGDNVMAVGAAAVERGWAGLHGIYVGRDGRRQGLARAISVSLLSRAHAMGARRAWLQVEQANAAAIPLYRSLGFETSWTYRHLVRDA
jgi:ribosomal protein S18 acetylase RimI-like enzyme